MLIKLLLKLQKVKYGTKFKCKGFPIIINKGRMSFGNNMTLNSSLLSNLIGLYQRTIIVTRTKNSIIEIGNNVGASGVTIYARNKITIGDNTLIGANSKIVDNDFHPLEIDARNNNYTDKIKTKEVTIGKNCFIGCNVLILKGTILKDGCIVGAGAVVSGIYEENSIIAGNPAKVIRKGENK